MKNLILFFVLVSLSSCNWINSTDEDVKNDSIKDLVVGADKDEHGCLSSAGYTWSKINKECVRVFGGIQLLPIDKQNTDDETLCVYVLFDDSGNKAELFMPNQDDSIVLERKSKNNPWKNDSYELISKQGYVLLKNGTEIYKGDGEIGSKISDSNDTEEVLTPTE